MAIPEMVQQQKRIAALWLVCSLAFLTGMRPDASFGEAPPADEPPPASAPIDATTLQHKVLCGYQGWFRCLGDGTDNGWLHWSGKRNRIVPETLTVEMWPDTSELTAEEKFPAPGFTYPDNSPAHLFSSVHARTVERHFHWMQQYGIDGVFVQRFLVAVGNPSFDSVLSHVRVSAAKTGRTYAICYDLTGAPADRLYDILTRDWKRLVDELQVTRDERYLHHAGKPVLFVWGFFSDRFSPEIAHRLIDFLKEDSPYRVSLIGGCPWYWRREQNAEWSRAFRRFDILSPWNVGHSTTIDGKRYAATHVWKDDLVATKETQIGYLPVIYPGFGWTNLKGPKSKGETIPRLGGEFYWRQFAAAADLGVDMAYVAMFDEVDEATAIFKVTNTPPTQAHFQTFEGLPTDWYLRLTGEGSKVIRGETRARLPLPFRP